MNSRLGFKKELIKIILLPFRKDDSDEISETLSKTSFS